MKNNFYVYAYLDIRKSGKYTYNKYYLDFEPFYIGKGKRDRKEIHLYNAYKNNLKDYKSNKIRKIKKETKKDPKILILENNLLESDSFNKTNKINR